MIYTRQAVLAALSLLTTPVCADPISGYVHADGTVTVRSALYHVSHHGVGRYTIKFATPMEPSANCVVTPMSKLSFYGAEVWRLVESDTECRVKFRISGSHSNIDVDFTFIAVPMSN